MRRALVLLALLLAPALHAAARSPRSNGRRRSRPTPRSGKRFSRSTAVRTTRSASRRTSTWRGARSRGSCRTSIRRARILIRAGDERTETLIEVPATFAIVRDARAEAPHTTVVPSMPGEAAREGDPGVVAWTDGDRAGGGLVER